MPPPEKALGRSTGEPEAVPGPLGASPRGWQEMADRYRAICHLCEAPVFVWALDSQGVPSRLLEANQAASRLLGYPLPALLRLSFAELVASPPCGRELVRQAARSCREGVALVFKAADGSRRERRLRFQVLGTGKVRTLLGVLSQPAADPLQMALAVLESALEGVAVLDPSGRIKTVNPTFAFITGYAPEELKGRSPEFLYAVGRNGAGFYPRLWEELNREGRWNGEAWGRRKNGEIYPQWLTLTVVEDPSLEGPRYVMLMQDLSETKRNQQRLQFLTQYDALTGLPNRTLLRDRLAQALARAQRNGQAVALMCLDVDNFKTINDSLGHAVGDQILQALAQRLEGCLRQEDTVARPGGDEFALVLGDVQDVDTALMVARRVQAVLSDPFLVEGHELYLSACIGLCLFPADGSDPDVLLRNAETAMYRAKEAGRGNIRLFTQAMNTRVTRRLTMETLLRKALQRGEFEVYYQPKVEIERGRIVGCEALVRWQRPEVGLVSPEEFIPLAEETGLIVPLGEWVLLQALADLRAWRQAGHRRLGVSVNFSARQLLWQHDVVPMVESALATTGLPPHCLELEMTESAVMHNVESAIATMTTLRQMGLRLALDDFGTGYSSLNYLKRFPLDVLKIDRSFVRGLPHDPGDVAIVSGIIDLGHNLELTLVAEGVENQVQRHFLLQRGCQQMQGFLVTPPLTREDFSSFLTRGGSPWSSSAQG